MKGDKGNQAQETMTLKDNLNSPMAKKKQNTPEGGKVNLKDYMISFDFPKECNTNNSFYENFLNNIQEDKKMLSSCHLNNGEVKAIQIKNVNSNFMSVQKISFNKSTNKKSQNTGEVKNNKEEKQENNHERDNEVLHAKQLKNSNNNNFNDDELNEPKEETKKQKKLKIQRTKAPPQLIRKKNFIFCCIPVSKK